MAHQPDNISAGTQVVALVEIRGTNDSLVPWPKPNCPNAPDYEAANRFLIKARREMANDKNSRR